MRISSETVDTVADIIEDSGIVPLPGGHGVWFAGLQRIAQRLDGAPGVVARCYACICLLGGNGGEERWNRKEWWPYAEAWCDQWLPELSVEAGRGRWEYLLAAMNIVVERWDAARRQHQDIVAHARECHGVALKRLTSIRRDNNGRKGLSTVLPAIWGNEVSRHDFRWDRAQEELSGPDAGALQMLYFLHVFHASLGLTQHSPDERYASRRPFYRRLVVILENYFGRDAEQSNTANEIAEVFKTTAVMEYPGYETREFGPLANRLPPCFQPAMFQTSPPSEAVISLRFSSNVEAKDCLLQAHRLAIETADLAMDFLRSGGSRSAAFHNSEYDYMHNVVRDGARVTRLVTKEIAPTVTGIGRDNSSVTVWPMSRAFAERMALGALAEPAQTTLFDPRGTGEQIDWRANSRQARLDRSNRAGEGR